MLPILWEAFQTVLSLIKEVYFIYDIIKYLIKWKEFILFLMSESVIITRVRDILYIILLGLFGILLGFLLGVYKKEDEICVLILLLLLQILYNDRFDYGLLKFNKADQFSTFSFKTIEQINPRPSRLIFKEPDQIPLPFLIIEDPFVFIETEVLRDKSINYEFELFKLYRNVNEKVNEEEKVFKTLALNYFPRRSPSKYRRRFIMFHY